MRVDKKLLQAHEGQDVGPFKKDERRRLRFIARFYQSDEFQTAMIKNSGEQLYSSIRSVVKSIDPSVWDAMHDKPQLQAPAVSAHLRMDGKPDGRYRENKGLRESELVPRRRVDGTPNIPAGQTEATRGTKPPVKAVEIPPTSTPVRLKKNGTRDLRYAANRAAVSTPPPPPPRTVVRVPSAKPAISPTPPSVTSVHFKKDGTPDMRYAKNRTVPAKVTSASSARSGIRAPSPTVSHSSPTPSDSAPSYLSSSSSGGGGREVFTGARGGTYYINSNGNKSYI